MAVLKSNDTDPLISFSFFQKYINQVRDSDRSVISLLSINISNTLRCKKKKKKNVYKKKSRYCSLLYLNSRFNMYFSEKVKALKLV